MENADVNEDAVDNIKNHIQYNYSENTANILINNINTIIARKLYIDVKTLADVIRMLVNEEFFVTGETEFNNEYEEDIIVVPVASSLSTLNKLIYDTDVRAVAVGDDIEVVVTGNTL